MRFLILDTDYAEFQNWLYAENRGLEDKMFSEQMHVRNESLFGTCDFYSRNLRLLGHEAHDVCASNIFSQNRWMIEHGFSVPGTGKGRGSITRLLDLIRNHTIGPEANYFSSLLPTFIRSAGRTSDWFYRTLQKQIEYYRPDILFNHDMSKISPQFLTEVKSRVGFLIGQHAATELPINLDYSCYDLILSSWPPTVEFFKKRGVRASLFRLAFEPRVLAYLNDSLPTYDLTFVGNLYPIHSSRIALLEALCVQFPQLKIWTSSIDHLPRSSIIRSHYAGRAWGRDMYQILAQSKITINHHGDVPPYANNMRLYEATGVGTLLVTDWKENLHEMFETGKEVAAYKTEEDCLQLIRYYLDHDEERNRIARQGQQKTLREHTYQHRMEELLELIHARN